MGKLVCFCTVTPAQPLFVILARNPWYMTDSSQQSQAEFSEQQFIDKLKRFAVQAGRQVVEKALTLYYAAQRPETPLWAKTIIYSALVYWILPTDAIPDFMPLVGYSDDLSTILSALTAVAISITPDVKETAHQQVEQWFGSDSQNASETPQAQDSMREIAID